ncbi:MAG: hypothetical protein HRT87_06335 [Legionellales bacterium]|nr:hypothetical protein [Legionellales bacterium]
MNKFIYKSFILIIFSLVGVANATTYTIEQGIASMPIMQQVNEIFNTTIYHVYLRFSSDDGEFDEYFHASIDQTTFSQSKILLQQKGVKINIHHNKETKRIDSKVIYTTKDKKDFTTKLSIVDGIYNKYDKQDYILLAGPRCDTITSEAISALGLDNKYQNINYINQSLKANEKINKIGKKSKQVAKEVFDDYKEAEKEVVKQVKPIVKEVVHKSKPVVNEANKQINKGYKSFKKMKRKWF